MSWTARVNRRVAAGCLFLFLLPACSGEDIPTITIGGDDDVKIVFPNVSWRFDAGDVLERLNGLSLSITSADINKALREAAENADRQLVTTVYLSDSSADSLPIKTPTQCEGTVCKSGNDQFDLEDLQLGATEYRPVMTYNGIDHAQFRGSEEPGETAWSLIDRIGYTGWLNYSQFALSSKVYFPGDRSSGASQNKGYAYSIGDAVNANPTSGKPIWTGSMIGHANPNFSSFAQAVQGEALVRVDLSQATATVTFSNIVAFSGDFTYSDMTWDDLLLTEGGFSADTIQGQFYGPDHEEIGGVFERDNIVGAFGASR